MKKNINAKVMQNYDDEEYAEDNFEDGSPLKQRRQ
jgi:hypothetical protein